MSRVAIVTGGTRGIGAAISRALKGAGYKVAASYAGNDEAAKTFNAETGIHVYKWDVSDYDACVAGIAKVEADLGPVEILVNNAGITKDGMFHKMTKEQWYGVINTNLNSLFNMTRPVWEGMRARKFGRVVCISSVNGQKGQMGQVNYSAAKAGDIGFVKALAQEGAKAGITVNAICPGYIATEMVKAIDPAVGGKGDPAAYPGRTPWRTRGNRPRGAVPRRRRRRFHHGVDAFGQWRPIHDLMQAPADRRDEFWMRRWGFPGGAFICSWPDNSFALASIVLSAQCPAVFLQAPNDKSNLGGPRRRRWRGRSSLHRKGPDRHRLPECRPGRQRLAPAARRLQGSFRQCRSRSQARRAFRSRLANCSASCMK